MTAGRCRISTLGSVLYLVGLLTVLVVGGLRADEASKIAAANGGAPTDVSVVIEATTMSRPPVALSPTVAPTRTAVALPGLSSSPMPTGSAIVVPNINPDGDKGLTAAAPPVAVLGPSTITRLVVPAIQLDKKVVEVGWTVQQQDGRDVAV